ncbi:unnamed protein product [Litomosoides sigmodontis]|uniref:Uncharacterized protein n=1 Tax=Litomosoides sigmodontis TaxID=42156 RepID=A0A3P7LWM6_LITSI|nr:unnamed protein product [Litomosoides sigmodontis]
MDEWISLLYTCLPDIQSAICEGFQSAECSVEVSPELTEPPFNFSFHALGKKIHLLPSGSAIPKGFHQISVISKCRKLRSFLAQLKADVLNDDGKHLQMSKISNNKKGNVRKG